MVFTTYTTYNHFCFELIRCTQSTAPSVMHHYTKYFPDFIADNNYVNTCTGWWQPNISLLTTESSQAFLPAFDDKRGTCQVLTCTSYGIFWISITATSWITIFWYISSLNRCSPEENKNLWLVIDWEFWEGKYDLSYGGNIIFHKGR